MTRQGRAEPPCWRVTTDVMSSAIADIADLPVASACDDPVDHFLTAWCPRCQHPVDAVCPTCNHTVEASGAVGESRNLESRKQKGEPTGAVQSCLSRSEFYRRFLQLLQTARNSKFTLGCYLIATGDAFAEGVSMAEFAKQWGVRRATVSKQCHLICAALGLPPSRYMRDEATCDKFRLTNRRPRKNQ